MKTIIGFEFSIPNRYIAGAEFIEEIGYTAIYYLYISKQSYLPTQFVNVFSNNRGFYKSIFKNVDLRASRNDSIWDINKIYPSYLKLTYKEFSDYRKQKSAVKIGQKAPPWILPSMDNDTISLLELKGSTVLLEFWFPWCGGCVKAVPDINEIQDKYSK